MQVLGAPQPDTVRIFDANTILWGAHLDGQPTALTLASDERAPDIADAVEEANPDIAIFNEIWSARCAQTVSENLRDSPARLSHVAQGPFVDGMNDIVNGLAQIHPYLGDLGKRRVDDIIRGSFSADNHTLAEDAKDISASKRARIKEILASWPRALKRRVVEVLKELGSLAADEFLRERYVFGSGLQIHSRQNHPMTSQRFVPHPKSAGVERLSQKGSLVTEVMLQGQYPLTVVNTHLLHGGSTLARDVRREQMLGLKGIMAAVRGPLIVAGDFNVVGDSDEYEEMMALLDLIDAYRFVHPDVQTHPGYTFLGKNEYSLQMGMMGVEDDVRLDYVMVRGGQGMLPISADVRDDLFRARRPNPLGFTRLSDHQPLVVDVAFKN